MTLLTVAEILSGETLVSPAGPIDATTAVATMDSPVWDSSDVTELNATVQPVQTRQEIKVEAGIGL